MNDDAVPLCKECCKCEDYWEIIKRKIDKGNGNCEYEICYVNK
jgi:hypothetical protein